MRVSTAVSSIAHAASLSEASIVFDGALALAGVGVTIHLATAGRWGRYLAFGCYLVAVELFASLVPHVSAGSRIIGGLVIVLLFWLLDRKYPREADAAAAVTAPHLAELKALADAYKTTVGYWRPAQGKQCAGLEKSFWDHCPAAGKALERADTELAKQEAAKDAFLAWVKQRGDALGGAGVSLLTAVERDTDLMWSVNSDYLWLGGGWGIAPVGPDTDVAVLKRPYEQLLTDARASAEGKALRAASVDLFAAQSVAQAELGHVALLKAIYGKCDLC